MMTIQQAFSRETRAEVVWRDKFRKLSELGAHYRLNFANMTNLEAGFDDARSNSPIHEAYLRRLQELRISQLRRYDFSRVSFCIVGEVLSHLWSISYALPHSKCQHERDTCELLSQSLPCRLADLWMNEESIFKILDIQRLNHLEYTRGVNSGVLRITRELLPELDRELLECCDPSVPSPQIPEQIQIVSTCMLDEHMSVVDVICAIFPNQGYHVVQYENQNVPGINDSLPLPYILCGVPPHVSGGILSDLVVVVDPRLHSQFSERIVKTFISRRSETNFVVSDPRGLKVLSLGVLREFVSSNWIPYQENTFIWSDVGSMLTEGILRQFWDAQQNKHKQHPKHTHSSDHLSPEERLEIFTNWKAAKQEYRSRLIEGFQKNFNTELISNACTMYTQKILDLLIAALSEVGRDEVVTLRETILKETERITKIKLKQGDIIHSL